jgi:hypothetical protein
MLARFGALNKWHTPKPGRSIGPEYCFARGPKRPRMMIDLPSAPAQTFELRHKQDKAGAVRQVSLHPVVEDSRLAQDAIAQISWYPSSGILDSVQVLHLDYVHSGISQVLTNMMFRDFHDTGAAFEKISSTKTLAYDNSDLSIVGLLEKFGIDHYKRWRLEMIAESLWDTYNHLTIYKVYGQPHTYYLEYFPDSCRAWEAPTFKVFFLDHLHNFRFHAEIQANRPEIKRMMLEHEAYVSLPMYMDPGKAGLMREYAAGLPENILTPAENS